MNGVNFLKFVDTYTLRVEWGKDAEDRKTHHSK